MAIKPETEEKYKSLFTEWGAIYKLTHSDVSADSELDRFSRGPEMTELKGLFQNLQKMKMGGWEQGEDVVTPLLKQCEVHLSAIKISLEQHKAIAKLVVNEMIARQGVEYCEALGALPMEEHQKDMKEKLEAIQQKTKASDKKEELGMERQDSNPDMSMGHKG